MFSENFDRNLFPQEELIYLYQLVLMAEARFLACAKAGDFPFYFQKMPILACREEVVLRFLGTQPSQEYMRKALAHCNHPVMQPVFEAWLAANPSEEEVERFKEYCKDFLAAYPEAAEKVNSL